MMPPPRSFDDLDGKERGQKKTDDLRAMTTLGPHTLEVFALKFPIPGVCVIVPNGEYKPLISKKKVNK